VDVQPLPLAGSRAAPQDGNVANAAARNGAPSAATTAAGDFQTFLTLLTAQMRNQDPLKPMESTEFVAQLASFSSVEQQIRTNDRLDSIAEALGGGGHAGLAQWIGREVRAPVAAHFQGAPVDVEVAPAADADRAVLVVRNAFDQIVARRSVAPGESRLAWDGQNALGEVQGHGTYRFELESYRGDALIATTPGHVFAPVTEVRLDGGAARLILGGGEAIGVEDVTAVR
jgi:flagellar basal-body rod modification protein FlgD